MQTEPLTAVKQQQPDARSVPGYLDFSVSVLDASDGSATVQVTGDVDCYTSPQLRSAFLSLVESGTRQVTLDLGGTQFVDSTGLSVMVGALKRLREQGGNLVLRRPTPATLRLLEVTGLTSVFELS